MSLKYEPASEPLHISLLPSFVGSAESLARQGEVLSQGVILWEGYHESRRCSRDTYPESYITKFTSIRRVTKPGGG